MPSDRPSPRPGHLFACRKVNVGSVAIGGDAPLAVIAGPCVIESESHVLKMAEAIAALGAKLKVPVIFKASYDKANRTSGKSFRGVGLKEGMRLFRKVKAETALPILTDVHKESEPEEVAAVCDMLQIPAFLCRQTDFVEAVGKAGKPVNVKKGQFLAPHDVKNVADKLREVGNEDVLLTDRGTSFGYNTLVNDFRGLATMQQLTGLPVCFDATHSVQQPGGAGTSTAGDRSFVPLLARAAAGAGINALFLETHDNPADAKSDGPNMVWLDDLEDVLRGVLAVDAALRSWCGAPTGK